METEKTPKSQPEIETFSREQLILPKEASQKALRLLRKAEEVGLGGMFESHWLSGVRLTRNTHVEGWNEKPINIYWEQIEKGIVSRDAACLPSTEILIDKTRRSDFGNSGRQLHANDPLGPLMARLRREGRISAEEDIPETSRFWIPPYPGLIQVVLPEILKLLEEDASEVRLPTAIEFNILGNFLYPHFGEATTREWFNDTYIIDYGLLTGGGALSGGLKDVGFGDREGGHGYDRIIAFRPLVVVSSKP